VGCQDQVLAAYGGFNHISFGGPEHLRVRKVALDEKVLADLQEHLMIFFTGISRTASEIAAHQVANMPHRTQAYAAIHQMTEAALKYLTSGDLKGFGRLLHESWQLKRSLSEKITTPQVDDIYDLAMKAGALGGKLLGAGGGGFVLIYVEPDRKAAVRRVLEGLLEIPFKFERMGTQIIFYQPNSGVV